MAEGERGTDVIDVALRMAEAIEAAGGSYFIGGSLASSLQGGPRTTNDIDIVLELPLGRMSELARLLGPDFEVDLDMFKDALLRGGSCNIFEGSSLEISDSYPPPSAEIPRTRIGLEALCGWSSGG